MIHPPGIATLVGGDLSGFPLLSLSPYEYMSSRASHIIIGNCARPNAEKPISWHLVCVLGGQTFVSAKPRHGAEVPAQAKSTKARSVSAERLQY